ncbi:MAG: vitamin K epoxide reductase family protein [Trueperella sp.]|nr:vitamin K epoxide reductase family protein [Trueperella sp.]
MARKSIDALSEAEMDRRIAKYEARPTAEQKAGGANRGTAWFVLIFGLIGAFASLQILLAEKALLKNPDQILQCDFNPIVGCSQWIGQWQNELFFGISNALIGLAFFAGVSALGLVLLSGGKFGRWLWQAWAAVHSLGMVWVFWFGYQSFVVENKLCPWCFLIWLINLALFAVVWMRSLQAGHWGVRATDTGRVLVRNRWWVLGALYLALVIFVVLWFWDSWYLVF